MSIEIDSRLAESELHKLTPEHEALVEAGFLTSADIAASRRALKGLRPVAFVHPDQTPDNQMQPREGPIFLTDEPAARYYGYTSSEEIETSRYAVAASVQGYKARRVRATAKLPAPAPMATVTKEADSVNVEEAEILTSAEEVFPEWEQRCYPLPRKHSNKDIDDRNRVLNCAQKYFDWQGYDEELGQDIFALNESFDQPGEFTFDQVLEFYDYYQEEINKRQHNPYKQPRRTPNVAKFARELRDVFEPKQHSADTPATSSDTGVDFEGFLADLHYQAMLPGTDDLSIARLQRQKLKQHRPILKPPIEGVRGVDQDKKITLRDVEVNLAREIPEWETRCMPKVELPEHSRSQRRRMKRGIDYEAKLLDRNNRLNFAQASYEWAGQDDHGNDFFASKTDGSMCGFADIMAHYDRVAAETRDKAKQVEPYRYYTKRSVRLRAKLGRLSISNASTKVALKVTTRMASTLGQVKERVERMSTGQKVAYGVGSVALVAVGAVATAKGFDMLFGGGNGNHDLAGRLSDFVPDSQPGAEVAPPAPRPSTNGILQDASKIIGEHQLPVQPSGRADGIHHTVQYGETLSGILSDNLQSRGHSPSNIDISQGSQMWAYFNGQDPNLLNEGQDVFFSDQALELIMKR